jgi:hypothetical protein
MPGKVMKANKNKSSAVGRKFSVELKKSDSKVQFTDNRPETIAQRKIQGIVNKVATGLIQQKGDRYYWYRPVGGVWTYAGAFKSHADANAWFQQQNFPQGTGFGQGSSKTRYK